MRIVGVDENLRPLKGQVKTYKIALLKYKLCHDQFRWFLRNVALFYNFVSSGKYRIYTCSVINMV